MGSRGGEAAAGALNLISQPQQEDLHQQRLSYGSQFGTSKAPSLRVGDGFSKDEGNLKNLLVCH